MRALTRFMQDYRPQGIVLTPGGGTGGGGSNIPLSNLGQHLGDWTRQPGDQRLGMPNGTYDAANFNLLQSIHSATGGTYNGWLILQAETSGGVTIDLADTGGTFRGGWYPFWDGIANGFTRKDLRILFVGINFINGETFPSWIRKLRYYHCTLSDEAVQWNNQYRTAYHNKYGTFPVTQPLENGGTPYDDNISGFGNPHPAAIRTSFCQELEFYYCDFLDVGDDAIESNNDSILCVGCRFDNIYHGAIQYFRQGFSSLSGDTAFHSDWIQSVGGSTIQARNCSFAGHGQFQVQGGSVTLDIDNFWLYNSDGVGMSLDEVSAGNGSKIVGNIRRGKWFANGQKSVDYTNAQHYDAGFDVFSYAYTDAAPLGSTSVGPTRLTFHRDSDDAPMDMLPWANAYHLFPSSVTTSSGLLIPESTYPRTPTIFNHSSNPAVIDRAIVGHGANDWETFFAGNWT